jgi:hypothetical protein
MPALSPSLSVVAFAALAAVPGVADEPDYPISVPIAESPIELTGCERAIVRVAGRRRLSIRNGPSAAHRWVAALADRTPVFVCTREGPWRGLVYAGPGGVCPHTGRWDPAEPGGCRAGWARRDWIRMIDD